MASFSSSMFTGLLRMRQAGTLASSRVAAEVSPLKSSTGSIPSGAGPEAIDGVKPGLAAAQVIVADDEIGHAACSVQRAFGIVDAGGPGCSVTERLEEELRRAAHGVVVFYQQDCGAGRGLPLRSG